MQLIKILLGLLVLIALSYGDSVDCPAALNSNGNLQSGLVKVQLRGCIGILLEDTPPGPERDMVASNCLSKDDDDFRDRGNLQTHYTDYRFQFRKYFNPGTDALSLPDDTLFEWEWLGPARRELFNSSSAPGATLFDSVVRDYIMTVVIITDVDSIAKSDPVLATVGQSIVETVDVPLDPVSFIERGDPVVNPEMKACLVEANYPPSSWSTSLPYSLFLDYCTADNAKPDNATEAECLYCHCTPPYPTIDCPRALELFTGKVTITATFTRIPWSTVLYNKWKFLPNGEPSQGANLVPYQKDLRQVYVKYRFFHNNSPEVIEKCAEKPGWRKLVTFSSVDSNNGKQAFHLGAINFHVGPEGTNPVFQRDGLYYLNLAHGHYHTAYYSNFTAKGKHKTFATNDTKRGFCLVSSKRVVNDIWAPWASPYTACDYQGITSGSADIYNEGIPCQWVDITDLPPGKVDLSVKINAWDALCEGFIQCNASDPEQILTEPSDLVTHTDDGSQSMALRKPVCRHLSTESEYLDDNGDSVKFNNRGDGESIITDSESQYGRGQEIGIKRNVEHHLYGPQLRSCTLGSTVTLSCQIPSSQVGGMSQIIRVCESSVILNSATGCLYNDALAAKLVSPGPINTTITFNCPNARDSGDSATSEPGGKYSLYRAHNVNDLAEGKPTVECVVL